MTDRGARRQWTRVFEATLQTLISKRYRRPWSQDGLVKRAADYADRAVRAASERERTATPERPAATPERPASGGVIPSAAHGIDVSQYQGSIDWSAVWNRDFAYIKATEGITYQDGNFLSNWINAKTAGLKVGGYHFFHPGDDPAKQAENFLSRLREVKCGAGDLIPAVDVEETRLTATVGVGAGLACLERFLLAISRCGSPILYTNEAFANQYLRKLDTTLVSAFWLAKWIPPGTVPIVGGGVTLESTSPPVMPLGWPASKLKLWQYSASGSVPGIAGLVDLDLFLGPDLSEITL